MHGLAAGFPFVPHSVTEGKYPVVTKSTAWPVLIVASGPMTSSQVTVALGVALSVSAQRTAAAWLAGAEVGVGASVPAGPGVAIAVAAGVTVGPGVAAAATGGAAVETGVDVGPVLRSRCRHSQPRGPGSQRRPAAGGQGFVNACPVPPLERVVPAA